MDYSVKVFCLKKGFVKLMIRLKRNTAQCAFAELLCAFKYSHWFNYSMFFKKQMFFILLSFLYFNQGRRSCPRASCQVYSPLTTKPWVDNERSKIHFCHFYQLKLLYMVKFVFICWSHCTFTQFPQNCHPDESKDSKQCRMSAILESIPRRSSFALRQFRFFSK